MVHRDLKPSNILRDDHAGRLRITDFGIGAVAARTALSNEASGPSTRGGRLLSYLRGSHTSLYASPQQRAGADPDPRDDVYALGVIAYQMLTGDLAHGVGADFGDDLRDAGVPEGLIELVGRCVAQKAERRPADGADLGERLRLVGRATPPAPSLLPPATASPSGGSKRGTTAGTRTWDEATFLAEVRSGRGEGEHRAAAGILSWAKRSGVRLGFGKATKIGWAYPVVAHAGREYPIVWVSTDGSLSVPFKAIMAAGPFAAEARRAELRNRLNSIPGVAIPEDALARHPNLPLAAFGDETVLGQLLAVLDWYVGEVLAG